MYGMKVCVVTDGGGRLPECHRALGGSPGGGEVHSDRALAGWS